MACHGFADSDLEKMVHLAIRWNENDIHPTEKEIDEICDGDEDILLTIKGLAEMRFLLWNTFEGGMAVLRREREESEQEFACV
jgi:hypothetical protein